MNAFKRIFLPALIAGLTLTQSGRVAAQTYTVLHTFTASPNFTNADGADPSGGAVLSGGLLYGVAGQGGIAQAGTLFSLQTNGSNFTVLHDFTNYLNGSNPTGCLFVSSNLLFGTAGGGGLGNYGGDGTVFVLNSTNLAYTNLHGFAAGEVDLNNIGQYEIVTNTDGVNCHDGVVGSGPLLYGATETGGSNATGTVFALNITNLGLASLHVFSPLSSSGTNADGATPWGGVVLAGNLICGTTAYGGTNGYGTVFGINTNNGVFTNLHSFPAYSNTAPYGNNDGAAPWSTLVASGNTVYGTTLYGGTAGNGTIFAVNTITGSFTNLHSFTNGDGGYAYGGLLVSGNTLYGTCETGGANGSGTVFKINADSSGYAIIYNFPATVYSSTLNKYTNSNGATPAGGLTLSGNTLYGTASGGAFGNGVVFSLSLSTGPQLAMIHSGTNLVITWPTNATGFTLQSVTNPSSTNWSVVFPAAVVVGGQYTVTNNITGKQMFYRLSQ